MESPDLVLFPEAAMGTSWKTGKLETNGLSNACRGKQTLIKNENKLMDPHTCSAYHALNVLLDISELKKKQPSSVIP